jgi:selenide, water dikinase
VYRLSADLALVQTVDFIAPVVDDPFLFGQIAAANSLSDVYAMGGRPLTAMNLVCFPSCELQGGDLAEILAGGASKVAEAGASLVGGHTVDNPELIYGLSVTGLVDPARLLTNAGAHPGDLLVLTEPLGLGLVATAVKAQMAEKGDQRLMAEVMRRLNRSAAAWMREFGATAATDITGFGFAGHALGVARQSGVDFRVRWADLPVLEGAWRSLSLGLIPGGAYRNQQAYGARIEIALSKAEDASLILCDPQTSGGLLVTLPASRGEAYAARLRDEGLSFARVIGEALPGEGRLLVGAR